MNKYTIILISTLAGATIYHFYLKRKGLFDTQKKAELMKDDNRIALHKYLDKITDGEVDEKEIEDKVYKIIQ
tara:strand:+ start:823 stop:1038 length:216 start_codon:yes stop_codon:yes gene_type:complete